MCVSRNQGLLSNRELAAELAQEPLRQPLVLQELALASQAIFCFLLSNIHEDSRAESMEKRLT